MTSSIFMNEKYSWCFSTYTFFTLNLFGLSLMPICIVSICDATILGNLRHIPSRFFTLIPQKINKNKHYFNKIRGMKADVVITPMK